MKIYNYLTLFFMAVFFCGCFAPIKNIIALSKNRSLTEEYVTRQEENFKRLVGDIKGARLSKEQTKEMILELYGEPIYAKAAERKEQKLEMWLYRMPLDYFASDKAYLYFDALDRLADWEYKEYKKAE